MSTITCHVRRCVFFLPSFLFNPHLLEVTFIASLPVGHYFTSLPPPPPIHLTLLHLDRKEFMVQLRSLLL